MKPHQIAEVKRRKLRHPHRGWHELIDEVVVEATLDPLALELVAALD